MFYLYRSRDNKKSDYLVCEDENVFTSNEGRTVNRTQRTRHKIRPVEKFGRIPVFTGSGSRPVCLTRISRASRVLLVPRRLSVLTRYPNPGRPFLHHLLFLTSLTKWVPYGSRPNLLKINITNKRTIKQTKEKESVAFCFF